MQYRVLKESDAAILTKIFSIPEYDMYFAENDTTEDDWKERIPLFKTSHSYIITKAGTDIGWIKYNLCGNICILDIIVLMPEERGKGYGKEVVTDLFAQNPKLKVIKLDVQQRNSSAIKFYQNLGFKIVSEETQFVNGKSVLYFNMELHL